MQGSGHGRLSNEGVPRGDYGSTSEWCVIRPQQRGADFGQSLAQIRSSTTRYCHRPYEARNEIAALSASPMLKGCNNAPIWR